MSGVYICVGLVIVVWSAYCLIPDVLLHRLGVGSWKRQFGAGVTLTFDDGPDPEVTPRVLQVLHKYDCRGVFFLVSEKAAQHPELVRQIVQAGHQIGSHGHKHRYAWFMSPWATWREWETSLVTLEGLSERKLEFIRPPWGTFNLVTWLWCKIRGKRAVLWGAEGHDWQVSQSPQTIAQRILGRVRPGTIVVLHDSGGEPGAPENSLQALEIICKQILREKKLPLVPLEFPQWSFGRRLTFRLWEIWERVFAFFSPSERISTSNLFKLAKTKYEGPTLYSKDGSPLAHRGDCVAEIHLDNIRLAGNQRDVHKMLSQALKQFRASMAELARFVADNPDYRDTKVFLGFTFINRGVKILGFEVEELPQTRFNRWIGVLQKGIMKVYHPQGGARKTAKLGETPKVVWISRETLLTKWLPSEGQE